MTITRVGRATMVAIAAWGVMACTPALAERGALAVSVASSQAMCQAARAALADVAGQAPNNLYSTAPPGPTSGKLRALKDSDLEGGWIGRAPTAPMIQGLRSALDTSAMACAEVKTAASASGQVLGDAEGRARLKAIGFNGQYVFLHYLSLPSFDRGGQEALVALSSLSNQLAGGVSLLLLRRVDGRWQVVGRKTLTVS